MEPGQQFRCGDAAGSRGSTLLATSDRQLIRQCEHLSTRISARFTCSARSCGRRAIERMISRTVDGSLSDLRAPARAPSAFDLAAGDVERQLFTAHRLGNCEGGVRARQRLCVSQARQNCCHKVPAFEPPERAYCGTLDLEIRRCTCL